MKKFKLFLSIAILFIALPTAMPAYDFLTLSLQWPPTVNPSRQSRQHLPLNFTIHGVWPDRYGAPPQQCLQSNRGGVLSGECCPRRSYVPFRDRSLLGKLKVSWPNLREPDNPKFWRHEWENHGGCTEAEHYDQTSYFRLGLHLKDQCNLVHFNPLNGWNGNLACVSNLTVSHIQKRVEFVCTPSTRFYRRGIYSGQRAKLREIHICFDPNLAMIDCPHRVLYPCPSRQQDLVDIPPW